MNTENRQYIYIEEKKQYISFSRDYYTHHLRSLYKQLYIVHSEHKHDNVTQELISMNNIQLFNYWSQKSLIVTPEDQGKILKLSQACSGKATEFCFPSFSVLKSIISDSFLNQPLDKLLDENLQKISTLNANLSQLGHLVDKYSNHIAFYCYPKPTYDYYRSFNSQDVIAFEDAVLSDTHPGNIKVEMLRPPLYELKPHVKTKINSVKKLFLNNKLTFTNYSEDNAATSYMYLVHTSSEGKEGFVNANSTSATLKTAELFEDELRAQRAVKKFGLQNYQIWKVGINFKEVIATGKIFQNSRLIDNIIAQQEKDKLEEMMRDDMFQKTTAKMLEYQQLLIEHGLLEPQVAQSSSVRKNKL